MKSFISTLFLLLACSSLYGQTYQRVWEKSQAQANYPTYLGTGNTERGFAFGTVEDVDRVYIVSRKSGTVVYKLNAATGDTVGRLDMTGIPLAGTGTTGTFTLNDIEVSEDGVIFGANLSAGSTTDSLFRVYRWSSEAGTATEVIRYSTRTPNVIRLGDKITVTGSAADNTLTIWASSTLSKVIKFTTADNGYTFTATVITLTKGANLEYAGNTPSVGPVGNGSTGFYIKASGRPLNFFNGSGAKVDSVSTSVVATGASAVRYLENNSKKYCAVYNFGNGGENMSLIDVTNGNPTAAIVFKTVSMGTLANANGTGDIGLKNNNDGTFTFFILGTNNGISAQKIVTTFGLKTFPGGFYNTSTGQLRQKDVVQLYFRNSASPFDIVDSATFTIDSVSFLGTTSIPNLASGSYYLCVKHRNSMETWSATARTFTRGLYNSFDFTSAQSQAYGSNQVAVTSPTAVTYYGLISGDVNQDGVIDLSDVVLVDNDADAILTGYVSSDLNGDKTVDASDITIIGESSNSFATVKKPAN